MNVRNLSIATRLKAATLGVLLLMLGLVMLGVLGLEAMGSKVQLMAVSGVDNLRLVEDVNEIQQTVQLALLLLLGGVIVLVFPLALWLIRQITSPLADAMAVADGVAAGDFDKRVNLDGEDEPARLLQSLARMQKDLKDRLDREHQSAAEIQRVKVALDMSTNSVMVANAEGRIIYCNAAVIDMMRHAEADIRRELPDFRADSILGADFDRFHRNPSHQRNLLASLNSPKRSQIKIGGRTFSLVASPIVGQAGARLGTVVEWLDRTSEVAIEQEVSEIIEAAAAGDFSRRIVCDDKHGFFLKLSGGVNRLLEANSQALEEVGRMLAALAEGDLTRKIETPYQGLLAKLKDDANSTVDNLQEIVLSIKQATDAINTAALEIANGNQDLSARTEEQASSLEQTASSMEQLTGAVRQNAEHAARANELAGTAQRVAEQGGEVVGQVVHTMNAIQQSSKRIADIIGVIDSIAFQTNILALNAAVEAARAGEQGRGFAVVATEVRNLAQRSAGAAKEIKALITDSATNVSAGNKLVDRAGTTMTEIVASIQHVARLMADISSASREQGAGIEQVGRAISQIDEVTQQNAALVEQAAAAAESLQEQAMSLSGAVSVFRVSPMQGLAAEAMDAPVAHFGRDQSLVSGKKRNSALLTPKVLEKLNSGLTPTVSTHQNAWAEF
jgi:methyl-accepting chemotaxis protein